MRPKLLDELVGEKLGKVGGRRGFDLMPLLLCFDAL